MVDDLVDCLMTMWSLCLFRKPEIRDELAAWSVELSSQLEKIPGRLLPAETLFMQNRDGSSAPVIYSYSPLAGAFN